MSESENQRVAESLMPHADALSKSNSAPMLTASPPSNGAEDQTESKKIRVKLRKKVPVMHLWSSSEQPGETPEKPATISSTDPLALYEV